MDAPDSKLNSDIIDGRYRIEKILGKGGMSVVYQVLDLVREKSVALKQFSPKEKIDDRGEHTKAFEYEYLTLAQLAHPNVITVYDYGKDEVAPYYTMELLDGGDLRQLSPISWRKACAIIVDVCSALGLLHSKRQVHRDLSPRNIRCTRDGKAKLIDFGAMTPMGPCRRVIGTPGFTAPEVLDLQPLNASTDLYSLGSTLYFALTRRRAYPARNFAELPEKWLIEPLPPSSYVTDIPKELDDLTLSLMSSDPLARPINSAVVIERLSAIAGLKLDDQLIVSNAYLTTPSLVGREQALARFRIQIARSLAGQSCAVLIEGTSGVGRSRFLETCALEAKLLRAVVLKADATDARSGDWGVLRQIALQLIEKLPELALKTVKPYVRVLANVFPDLLSRFESDPLKPISAANLRMISEDPYAESFSDDDLNSTVFARRASKRPSTPLGPSSLQPDELSNPQELRSRVQIAFRDWILQVSGSQCLMLAIDDIDRIDEPSAAFLGLIAHEKPSTGLFIATTWESDTTCSSEVGIKLLRDASDRIKLTDLSLKHTEALLSSIFGEAPNVRLLADRLHAISDGNPQGLMQLTQHLVDRKLVRYQAGTWTLPSAIDASDLPSSVRELLVERVNKLGADARVLAQTLALCPSLSVNLQECLQLTEHQDAARLLGALDELVAGEILSADEDRYAIAHQVWISILVQELDEVNTKPLQLRLAEMFEKRGNEPFRTAQLLLAAGETERALDAFIRFAESSKALTDRSPEAFSDLLQSLPRDWYESYKAALTICETSGRPKRHLYVLQARLSGLTAFAGVGETVYITEYVKNLVRDSGLELYHELGDSVPADQRLSRSLELAQQRFDSSDKANRGLAPIDAIRQLVQATIQAIGYISTSYDFMLWQSLPSLEPFSPLSPALVVVDKLFQALGNRITGREQRGSKLYREVLDLAARPDRAGLEETHHRYIRFGVMRSLAMTEAAAGLASALNWASEIEAEPLHQVNAWRIRKLYFLLQGATQEVERCTQRIEQLQIRNSPVQWFEGSHLGKEVVAYALADDLIGVKNTIDGIETMAKRFVAWVPTMHYARGEYQRIRGDYNRALKEFEEGMRLSAPGRHQSWADIAGAYLRTLILLRRYQDVVEIGPQLLEAAQNEDLGYNCNYLRMPLAIAAAKLRDAENALNLSNKAVASWQTLGVSGLNLGLGYETRARVALALRDEENYKIYAKLCEGQYRAGNSPSINGLYEKLIRDARHLSLETIDSQNRTGDLFMEEVKRSVDAISNILSVCTEPQKRAEKALDLLIQHSNSKGGFLYIVQRNGPVLVAQSGDYSPPANMESKVRLRLSDEIDDQQHITATGSTMKSSSCSVSMWSDGQGGEYLPILIADHTDKGFIIAGIAVLRKDPEKVFCYPAEAVVAVSRVLLESGDVVESFVRN
ncbi:MAG: protein kinase [Deltaproteobacteria bacterium]|nr:protein kinase [Deltaproteobacteria bacterium]